MHKQKRKTAFMGKKAFSKFFGVLRQNHLLLWKTQGDAERGLPELMSFFIDTYSELSSANHTCNSESTAGDAAQGEGDPTKEDSEGANGQWANGKCYELQLGMSTHQHSTSVQYDKRWLAFDSEDERHSFIEAVETAAKQLGQQPPPPKREGICLRLLCAEVEADAEDRAGLEVGVRVCALTGLGASPADVGSCSGAHGRNGRV